jgi:serralysin
MCTICLSLGRSMAEALAHGAETPALEVNAPVASLDYIVYALRTSWTGTGVFGDGTTREWAGTGPIIYCIPDTPFANGGSEIAGQVDMTALMKQQARLAFELWDDLIARDLTESGGTANAQIQFCYSSQTQNGGTYAKPFLTQSGTGDYGSTHSNINRQEVWLNSTWASHDTDSDLFLGGYGLQTYIHEIGHALGLSHPGTYNAAPGVTITYQTHAEYAQDTRRYTVMSYFNANDDGSGTDHFGASGAFRFGATPLLHDIAAVQAMYGADMTTRTGNTTYGFNSNAGRAVFDFTLNPDPIVAIWDAGGIDTLDASGFSQNQRISLEPGTFSDIGAMTNNVAIAFGATIENAVGGSGADTLIGNSAGNMLIGNGGNDVIDGMGGNDTLMGGAGRDQLIGGSGFDYATYETASSAVAVFIWQPAQNSGDAAGDTFSGVEGLVGSRFNDTLGGDEGLNVLSGLGGHDVLFGAGGADVLVGGLGDDSLFGGIGADQLHGEDGFDWARYDFAGAGVAVFMASTGASTGEAAGDTFFGIEGIVGSSWSDTLSGGTANDTLLGAGGHDVLFGWQGTDALYGGGGDDSLFGGLGGDYLNGDVGFDWARYDFATAPVAVNLAGTGFGGEASGDAYAGVDGVVGSDLSDYIVGDGLSNVLSGGLGNDILVGGAGGDGLYGGAGVDTLYGQAGNDALHGGAGADFFMFARGEGPDQVLDFSSSVDKIGLQASTFVSGLIPGGSLNGRFAYNAPTSSLGQFIFNTSNNTLYWDSNGIGAGGLEALAVLQAGATLTQNDLVLY